MFKKLMGMLLAISFSVLAKPTLTVYTYDSFTSPYGPGAAIKQAFEKKCNCQIKFVAVSDGVALLNRLRMEGKNSPADIAIGLDNNIMQTAEDSGLFLKQHIETNLLKLPQKWTNQYFIPYDYGYFSFIYNSEKLKSPPTSLHELVNSTQPWTIIYEDPRTSTPGLGLLLWMNEVFGDHVSTAWQKLAKKTVTVTKGWSEAYGLFLKGEADLVLSYSTSPVYHIDSDHDFRYKSASFKEGQYLQIEVAGQLVHSKHPHLAHEFMQFIISPEFQEIAATKNYMYPVTNVPLPQNYQYVTVPTKALMLPAKEVDKQRSQWVQIWQKAVSQ